MNTTPVLLGEGRLTWGRGERVGDRYGAVVLMRNADTPGVPNVYSAFPDAPTGTPGIITAEVVETRASTHVGDLFRGFSPSTPEVGERIELGTGRLFTEDTSWGAQAIGVEPADGRDKDWMDPKALYRAHEQTVRLYFTPEES